jgi:putative flippase GtrA
MNALARKQLLKYLAAGASSYLFEVLSIKLFGIVFGETRLTIFLAFMATLAFSFCIQKSQVFKAKGELRRRATLYGLLACINLVFALIAVPALNDAIGGNKLFIARAISLIPVTIWNFLLGKYLIFNTKEASLHKH